jgi:polar amino acid transport system permease protein
MDWRFMAEYAPVYAKAALLTARIAASSCALSLALGALCAGVKFFRVPALSQAAGFYIELSRNTPLLVQLFFLYFGLPKLGIMLSSETCALAGLTFLGAGYMAEAMRGALEAVEKHQTESALSLGMTRLKALRHVIAPQAAAIAAPGVFANVIFLIKETSVFSVVALADLMYVAKDLIGLYYKTNESLTMLVLFYIIILLPVSVLAAAAERRLKRGRFRRAA